MSEALIVGPTSSADDPDLLAAALGGVPLFAGMSHEDLLDFASVFKRVELGPGAALWRQAGPVEGLHILLGGEARVSRRLPGERDIEVARLGPGAVMGEIPLLGGGTHSASVRAVSPCSLVYLHRDDFHARIRSGRPSALTLKRRIVEIVCARVRTDHASLVASMSGDAAHVNGRAAWHGGIPDAQAVATPSHGYAAHLPFFRQLGAQFLSSLLDAGETLKLPPRCVLLEEGDTANHCYITLNGAVEDVLRRGARTIRVRFAGPGRASCYLGLLDGGPATATSVTRERTVVLALDAHDVRTRLERSDDPSRAFAAAVEHDLMDMLRSTASPKAHLAAAGAG